MAEMSYDVALAKVEECPESYIVSFFVPLEDGPEPDDPVLLFCKLKKCEVGIAIAECDERDCPRNPRRENADHRSPSLPR